MLNSNYISLLILAPVVPMIVSDFYRRRVALAWLVAFTVLNVTITIILYDFNIFITNVLFNIAVLAYMACGVLLYIYIKHKKVSTIKHYVGMGDVVFLFALTPIFEFYTFLYFLIGSCIAALVWWGINYLINKKNRTIPFVGVLGCVLSGYIIINAFK